MAAKKKEEPIDDPVEENEYSEPEGDDYGYDNDDLENNEGIKDKPTMEVLFDTGSHLKALEKQFRGFIERDSRWIKSGDEMARDIFIDKMVGGLRSIINPLNLYTYKSEEEVETILLEKNEEFIKSALNERTIADEDLVTMTNIFDHALQTFMGHIAKGHGSIVIRDIYAGQSQQVQPEKKDNKFMDTVGGLFSFGGNN